MGGQTAFLDRFIGELAGEIFGGIDSLVFIVDTIEIKDITRAKYYFDRALERVKCSNPDASVFVFLHKIDLLPKALEEEVCQICREFLLEGITREIRFYETTIFTNSSTKAVEAVYRENILLFDETLTLEAEEIEHDKEEDKMLAYALREALKAFQEEGLSSRSKPKIGDPTYIQSAIETLNLIQRLFDHSVETQTMDKLTDYITQIELKADARVSSTLGVQLGIDIPIADQEEKPTKYWEGVRDMARLVKKQFLTLKDDQKFTQFLRTTRDNLLTDDRGFESPPTPYIYEFPYPKGPPTASAEVIPLKDRDYDLEANSEDQLTPQDTSHLGSPPIKSSPTTSSLPEKLLYDEHNPIPLFRIF